MIDGLLSRKNGRYQEFLPQPKSRDVYEIDEQDYGFNIVYANNFSKNYMDKEDVDDLITNYNSGLMELENMSTLKEIITNPWENTFGMGQSVYELSS